MSSVVREADKVFLPRPMFVRCTDHSNGEVAKASMNVFHRNELAAEFVLNVATGDGIAP